jgi:RimJ/RimL family protein N-acetyltransferase
MRWVIIGNFKGKPINIAMRLRPAEEKDIDALHGIINEPGVIAAMPLPRPVSLERVELWLCSAPRIGLEIFVIEDGGAVVGCTSFSKDGLISLWIEESAQGRGIGSEALAALLRLAKKRGLRLAKADCLRGNRPAIAFFERAGFVEVGKNQDSVFLERAL